MSNRGKKKTSKRNMFGGNSDAIPEGNSLNSSIGRGDGKKSTKTCNLLEYIDESMQNNIESLFMKTSKNKEFEFIFMSKKNSELSQEKYIQLLKFVRDRSTLTTDYILTSPEESLDIIYRKNDTSYRCSLIGKENMNKFMKPFGMMNNHVILSLLCKKWKSDKNLKGINFTTKVKEDENTINVDEFDFRARLSDENEFNDKDIELITSLDERDMENINFRYKQRTSLYVIGNSESDKFLRIDITLSKNSRRYNDINRRPANYELELEYGNIGNKNDKNDLNKMFIETDILLKVIQFSRFLIPNSMKKTVIQSYKSILMIDDKNKMTSLDARQATSLEIHNVTNDLQNKYAVTDKADGDRYFLIILKKRVYLISFNLNVKDTGIILNTSDYDGSIMDGELIFIKDKNRHIYLVFDCLTIGTKDIRNIVKLSERQHHADIIIENCFILKKQKGYTQKTIDISGEFNLTKYVDMHHKQIVEYMNILNDDIDIEKQYPLIRRKYFIESQGAKDWEIFAYAVLMWNSYRTDSKIRCPYLLDGLIFQPNEQAYITDRKNKDNLRVEYKWKPSDKNSIDFYIEFLRDEVTNKILTIYDNSYGGEDFVKNKPYRICYLYVGENMGGDQEHPILFKQHDKINRYFEAYIYLSDGEPRDLDGDIINDRTVVEFYYNSDEQNPHFKWVPIRTRYDKTESVIKYKKKYGNYKTVANSVWQSIIKPITIHDFEDLAKGNNPDKNQYYYNNKLDKLRKMIDAKTIAILTKKTQYYQRQDRDIAGPMRQFHNWIKSNLIQTYCGNVYAEHQTTVLDIGVGRGGDLRKYYLAKVKKVVGIDPDKQGLIDETNGAISRYKDIKKKMPNVPQMDFIRADAGVLLNFSDQNVALGGIDNNNRKYFEKYFSDDPAKRMKFDRINCQFAIHYLLSDSVVWNNFKTNINNYLDDDGYMIITAFDGKKVAELLHGKEKYTSYIISDKGKKEIFFEIVKKYEDKKNKDDIFGTGNAIDIYFSWISEENRYITEYLVDPDFLTNEFMKDCNMELVDTDNFENQFEKHKQYFLNSYKYEFTKETKSFLDRVAEFYNVNKINEGSYIYTSLMRYYVFRKKEMPKNMKQKGGFNMSVDNIEFKIGNMLKYDSEHSYSNSIHHVLLSHKLIPKITTRELFNDQDLKLIPDNKLTHDKMKKIGTNMNILHTIERDTNDIEKTKKYVNSITTLILEKNCNGEYDIDVIEPIKMYKISSKDKAIILYKENDVFYPLYINDELNGRRGLHNYNDKIVQSFIEKAN